MLKTQIIKEVTEGINPQILCQQVIELHKNPTNLPLDNLIIPEDSYHRTIRPKRLKKMIDEFDPYLFYPILVGKRDNGQHYVIDGHYRHATAVGLGLTNILCTVIESEGEAYEADLFMKANSAKTKLKPYEIFNCHFAANGLKEVAIAEILAKYNFTVGPKNDVRSIALVNDLLTCYDSYGSNCMDMVFYVLDAVYPDDKYALRGDFFKGLSYFIHTKMTHPNFKLNKFVETLQGDINKGGSARKLAREIERNRGIFSFQNSVLEYFTYLYNFGKKSTNRI